MKDHPIPPVTEAFQYRAIGVFRGIYEPESQDKFTRGKLIDENGRKIDSVVLGRVITLMKRHLAIDKPHLWVVYPRCRDLGSLHLQIAGIWEPSTLDKTEIELASENKDEKQVKTNQVDQLPEGDDYFSIRGEIIFTRPETSEIVIKIRQRKRSNLKRALPFKLVLEGEIPIEHLRCFASLKVKRNGQKLVLEAYEIIGSIPTKGSKHQNKIEKNQPKV